MLKTVRAGRPEGGRVQQNGRVGNAAAEGCERIGQRNADGLEGEGVSARGVEACQPAVEARPHITEPLEIFTGSQVRRVGREGLGAAVECSKAGNRQSAYGGGIGSELEQGTLDASVKRLRLVAHLGTSGLERRTGTRSERVEAYLQAAAGIEQAVEARSIGGAGGGVGQLGLSLELNECRVHFAQAASHLDTEAFYLSLRYNPAR